MPTECTVATTSEKRKESDGTVTRLSWEQRNPERANAKQRRSYQRHKERRCQQAKEYRAKKKNDPSFREHIREMARNNYRQHRDKYIARSKKYRDKNPEEYKRRARERYWKVRETRLAVSRERAQTRIVRLQRTLWKINSIGKKRGATGVCTLAQLVARMEYYAYRCWVCRAPCTAVDHLIPLSKGGTNWPANLRPICHNCNARKGNRWTQPPAHIPRQPSANFY